jgi:hypothetical protein
VLENAEGVGRTEFAQNEEWLGCADSLLQAREQDSLTVSKKPDPRLEDESGLPGEDPVVVQLFKRSEYPRTIQQKRDQLIISS